MKNAIRRYETCWLPLVAEHNGKEVAPPLDVHWVWHVHMLAPYYYEKDCLHIVNMVPDHKLLSDNARHSAMDRAKSIWEDRFKGEPFHITLDNPQDNGPGQNGMVANGFPDSYQSRCRYNLESASARQRLFYYQVSLNP